jgi:predicted transcriptional regulator
MTIIWIMISMRQETVHSFTEKEEEFANLLIGIGMKKNIAKVLVFLASITEATSREIERGLDMRQPEVSKAMKYLMDEGWIRHREITPEKKGRPVRIYELAKPMTVIIDSIEKEKKNNANNLFNIFRKLREDLP